MSYSNFQNIIDDLPNFPEAVIEDWLLPLADQRGWPPTEEKLGGVLMSGSLNYWQSVIWSKQSIEINKLNLSDNYEFMTNEMLINYCANKASLGDSTRRINYSIKAIKLGKMKPIVLIKTNRVYDIADGNHRITAYKFLIKEKIISTGTLEAWVGDPQAKKVFFSWNASG